MIPKKLVLGLDPRMEPGFPPSRSPLRRAKEGRKRSCSNKMLEPIRLQGSLARLASNPDDAASTQRDGHAVAGDCRRGDAALDCRAAARRGGAARAAPAARRRYLHRGSL